MGLFFFLSGATSLAYEVIWFKQFSQIWGSSSLAIAVVVALFLFGLGLGGQLIGLLADRLTAQLRWYGASEIAIGLFAAVIPWELQLLRVVGGQMEAALPDSELPRLALRFALTFVVIGPPCFLMGGTLPLLVRQFTSRSLSDAIGWLYGINTLGAAAGCYLSGFHLLPQLGILGTNHLAVATNLSIGLASFLVARKSAQTKPQRIRASKPEPRDNSAAVISPGAGRGGRLAVMAASALAGCAALILQITWARQLALALGGSTYAFTAALFMVLLGIAAGGLLFHIWLRRYQSQNTVAAIVIFLLAAGAVAGQQRLPWLCDQAGLHRQARADLTGNALVCVLESAALELIPSLGAGILFPLLVQATRQNTSFAGRAVGNVYAFNTLGSLVGAALTAEFLFPSIGTAGSAALALAMYALAALLIMLQAQTPVWRFAWALWAGTLVCAVFAAQRPDPLFTDLGMYFYGYSPPENRFHRTVDFFREGRSSDVLVIDVIHDRALRVNGKIDAGTGQDMATQLGLAYFPRALRPAAKEVLVIGYGSGVTAGASLLFPQTKVACCEIEPAIFEASRLFARINHRAETSPNLEMQFDDGRAYLQRTSRQFDLIISEPSNPWMAGVSNLFTREFFEIARRHLGQRGVLCQWLQTYHFSFEEYGLIVRTIQAVFPYCAVVCLEGGGDTLLLASAAPLTFGTAEQSQFQASIDALPAVREDLNKYFGVDDGRYLLLRHFGPDQSGLAPINEDASSRQLNTDLNLRLEFDAPLRLFDDRFAAENDLPGRLIRLRDRAWIDRLCASMGIPPGSAINEWARGSQALAEKRLPEAALHLKRAIELDPRLYVAYYDQASVALLNGDEASAIESMTRLLPLRPSDPRLRTSLANLLLHQRKYQVAADQLRDALRLDPSSVLVRMNLAWVLATSPDAAVRKGPEAVKLAEKACRATRFEDGYCVDVLAAALAETGDFARAVHLGAEAVRLLQRDGQDWAPVEERLTLYRRSQRYREPD